MNLRQRSYKAELLDNDNLPFEDIRRNMEELNFINTWLGGHQITIKALQQFTQLKTTLTVCEIGCGGGDNLLAIYKWCKANGILIKLIGVDIKDTCIAFARSRKNLPASAEWITSDYKKVAFESQPDVIFSSLFCHHFTNEALIEQLQWMSTNSRLGFFINDLQRHPLAYRLIKLLTGLFSHSYLVKNDAPLSVARGFKKHEWQQLLQAASIKNVSVKWQWAFRYIIIHTHG